MDRQPVLQSDLLELRLLRSGDRDALFAVAADPLIWEQHPASDRWVEIGWTFLARSHWGGRYNGEMKRLMLEHAFGSVERVVFIIGPANWRSRRAVEKLGGVLEGLRKDDTGRECAVYVIHAPGAE